METLSISHEDIWKKFQSSQQLADEHLHLFKSYATMLRDWNEKTNLTAITELSGIINHHFQDSLALKNCYPLSSIQTIADIGAGAGFPAIPLKILYPHLTLYLVEVKQKKREFLSFLCKELHLTDVHLVDLDWRTFLRTTNYPIDLFVSRAAFGTAELVRLFRHTCPYRDTPLIYWASHEWQAEEKYLCYVQKIKQYTVRRRQRKLVFFGLHPFMENKNE